MIHTLMHPIAGAALAATLFVALAPVSTAFAPATAQEALSRASSALDGEFVEVLGETEFTGVLCARPLQPEAAEALGLTLATLMRRADQARDAIAALTVQRYVAETDEYLVLVPDGETENSLASALMATGGFQYVEPDWMVFPIACPDDAQFGQQWHHQANRMQSCAAWDIETGDPSVIVAICDTGIRATHEDLLLHRQEGYHAPSQTWESNGGPIDDINGHGTLCVGSAAANGDNGVGVSGVGWNLGHRTMRVTDSTGGGASISNLTNAARTAADVGDRVASVSYSGVTSGTVNTAGTYIRSRNALLVWAAGNSSNVLSGNRDDDVIIVGATSSTDALAGFSNRGSLVDLSAPGVGIRTTNRNSNSGYSNVSGTSFACPITAGLCGLIWSRNPLLTPAEVEQILRASCDDLGAAGVDDTFGYGRINSAVAMQMTPGPLVSITFPNGRPDQIAPSGGAMIDLLVTPGADTPNTSAALLWIDTGMGFSSTPVAFTGGAQLTFQATFPAVPCPSDVSYYFEFPLVSGQTVTSPLGGSSSPFTVLAIETNTLVLDEVESGAGWSVGAAGDAATTGIWTLVDPIGTSAAPEDDHTPSGSNCFVTGQGSVGGALGENDVDGGRTTLFSPILDLSGFTEPSLGYWRWYSNGAGSAIDDTFTVDVTDDGGATWVNVETLGPNAQFGGWQWSSFRVADLVAPNAAVQLRFVASDLGQGSIVEAGIDDLEVFESCPNNCGFGNYCITTPNSVGAGALIEGAGSASFAANDLTLLASGAPSQTFGLFIYSPDQTQSPAGAGTLCVGTTTFGFVIRLAGVQTDALGSALYAFDNTAPPIAAAQVAPGTTWYFQFVYRDNTGGSPVFNFTNGLAVTFCQ